MSINKLKIFIISALIFSFIFANIEIAFARTLYVSESGNPDVVNINDGDFFSSASLAFREAAEDNSVSEIIIFPGIYRETIDLASITRENESPLVARSAKLGDVGYSSGMAGKKVVISGNETLESLKTSDWEFNDSTKIWSVTLSTDEIYDVFYNGHAMFEARWPDITNDNTPPTTFAFSNLLTDKAWCRTVVPGTGIWPVI